MTLSYSTNRYKTKSGKKYYLGLDSESYSVYSFKDNVDYTNRTGTLMYTESLRLMKKGATDDLINDNPTLIDEYGSIDFLDTVRSLVVKEVSR